MHNLHISMTIGSWGFDMFILAKGAYPGLEVCDSDGVGVDRLRNRPRIDANQRRIEQKGAKVAEKRRLHRRQRRKRRSSLKVKL